MLFQEQSQRNASLNFGEKFGTRSNKILNLDNVSVQFEKVVALKNIQLEINSGEVIFITGASGAGKTTLLKVLSGEIDPVFGSIEKHGRRSGELFVARVFQDLRLMDEYTGLENLKVAYDPSLYRNRKEFNQDLEELAYVLGIQDRLNLKMSKANGGLRQKIGIIRALLSRPDIFIADEPTSSLDVANAKRLFEVLSLFNKKRGVTIIWATHNRELIKNFDGRIVHLDSGKLIYSGHACFI